MTEAISPLGFAALRRWVADETWLKRVLTARRWMSRAYFEARYVFPDPWRLATSAYERDRAEASLRILGGRRYISAIEVGCGEGIFTSRLVDRCAHLVAVDFSTLAIRRARRRFASDPRVDVRQLDVRVEDLNQTFDLVYCAELFYYLNREECEAVSGRLLQWLAPGGDLCLGHGTSVHDVETVGGESGRSGSIGAGMIHERFRQVPGLAVVRDLFLPRYRLTVLRRLEESS